MRPTDLMAGGALAAAAVVAAALGAGGLRHPGLVAAPPGGALTTAGGAGATATTTAKTVPAHANATANANSNANSNANKAANANTAGNGATGTGAGTGAATRSGSSGASSAGASGGTAPAPATGLRATTIKLSASPYGAYAVAVYPRPAPQAGPALDGFALQVVPAAGGLRQVEISVPGAGVVYRQKIDVGDRVYFVEGSMGDDAPGTDVNGGDDGVVITNAQGYILQ
jgi:hypothetical protein